jgi:hypothetical protein
MFKFFSIISQKPMGVKLSGGSVMSVAGNVSRCELNGSATSAMLVQTPEIRLNQIISIDYDPYEQSGFYESIFFMTFIQIFIAPLIYRLYISFLGGYFASEKIARRRN